VKRLLGTIALTLVLVVAPLSTVSAGSTSNAYDVDVTCKYRSVPVSGWDWKMNLRRLRVDPPAVFANKPQQLVGWRFIVQKRNDNIAWKRMYRSSIQKATALDYLAANFARMTFDVPKPKAHTHYRVIVKVFWYRTDGTVQATDRFLVNEYRVVRDGQLMWIDSGGCAFSWLSNQ
jgi:hypothetical protein